MTVIDRRHTQTEHQYAADDLEVMQEAKRYSDHLFGLFKPYVGRHVLEVGCGIGTMSRKLLDVADTVFAIEPNLNCATRAEAELGTHPRFTMRTTLLEDCDPAELASHAFDTVFCINVLEHIKDDVAALKTFEQAIVPGGHVLIWVPALQMAYGPLDAELGHYRRYTKASLSAVFHAAGLDLVSIRYSNPIGLLGWMVNAHITKSTTHSPSQVKLFDTLVAPWALPLEKMIPPPIGLSLAAIGRRRS